MFVSKADLTKMAIETNTGFAAVYQELREIKEELKLVKELAGVTKKASSISKKESQENT